MTEEVKFKGIAITLDERRFSKDFEKGLGIFTFQIPLPYEKASIISATSRVAGGQSIESIGKEGYEYIRMIVTLNSVIVEKPAWWEGADYCPDDDFLFELWRFYLDCEQKFAARLKSKVNGKNMEVK